MELATSPARWPPIPSATISKYSPASFFKIVTEFGNYTVMIPIIIIFYLFNKDQSFNKYFTINLISVFLSNFIVKSIIRRDRPIDINLIIENGFSFPSGHSMVSFAFYGFLIYYLYHTDLKKPLKYSLMIFLSFIILTSLHLLSYLY